MKNKTEVNLMSPLVWAYVGDSVYELFIRTHLVENTNFKPHKLHIETIKYVKAKAQAKILEKLQEDYDCIKVANWRECKELLDNIDTN